MMVLKLRYIADMQFDDFNVSGPTDPFLVLHFFVKNVVHKNQALEVIHKSQGLYKLLNMKEAILPTDTNCKSQATE